MKIVTDAGVTYDLGVTETTPTVGITDFSRRATDDFGITTVVRRGFARRMSVRFALPFDTVDAVQARMAALRATPATFVADDRYRALSVRGIFKDFDIDLAVPPTSYCTLSVDGLAETDTLPDPGGDAAPEGSVSTLRLVQPVDVTDAVLTASSVPENDAPAWSADMTYADAARVIVGHRVYESLVDGNRAADPITSGKWVDIGPTNRWAMFDDALGSVTSAAEPIVVTLAPGVVDTIVLLDVIGATVRVQAAGYDRTLPVVGGAMLFEGLPGGALTVTIAGAGGAAVGTLLVGRMVTLGITEASPTAGISDFSRKEVDDFGEVTIVQRAWSKRMTAKALIRSAMVDAVFDRIAAVRARPCLWIGDAGTEALTVFGFFKDFSIEVGEGVSKLSLSIEGLSAGAPQTPRLTVPWSNITDPKGTKPADNATNSGDPESPFGPGKVKDVLGAVGEMPDLRTAIAVILDTPELADFVDGAHRLRDQTRQQLAAHLADQLLAQARAQRTDELTHIDGLPVGPVVKRVDRARQEGDEALAESITVVKADGERTAGELDAEVLRLDRARIDAQQAEAVTLSNVRAQLSSDVDSVERLTLGQVSRLDHAIADASGASATALQETEAQFGADVDGVERLTRGEIARLDTAVANAEGAQATALQETRAHFSADVDGVERRALGEVTRLDQSLADAAGASAAAVANVQAQFDGEAGRSRAEVARLDSAVATGAQAAAQAIEQTRAELGDDITAEVLRLDSVIAEAERVSAQALQSVRAELVGEVDGVSALFAAETIRLDTTIAEKDRAVARALQDVRAELGGDQIGEVARLSAAITRLDEAIVDANGARAQSVEEVRAQVDGQVASVQFLMRAANGDEAVAQLLTTVGGVITGFKINGATYDFAIHAKRTTFIDPVSGKVYFYADADGKVRMDDVEVNRIAADAIDSPSLKRAAVSKTSFLSLDADRACERNVATTVVSYTFVKEDADSILKIQMFAQCYHADDLDFWGDIVVDGVARQRAQVRMPFDNANSRGQAPITPTVFLPGIGAGEHSVAFVLTSNETEGPTYVRAGSTLEVTELRRGAIGNASGSAAPVDPPPDDETGGGGGGSGDPDWDYGGGGGGWYEPTVPQQ